MTFPVRTQMIGDHHVSNCLVAAAVGLAYGFELAVIVRGLESVSAVPGRLERIECGQPFGVFVDYAHTPDALATVLDAMRRRDSRPADLRFWSRRQPRPQKRPLMGQAVAGPRGHGDRHERQSSR